jgi:hypothetical protein
MMSMASDFLTEYLTMAREWVCKFGENIVSIYQDDYLRIPNQQDLQAINRLHTEVHGFEGMVGSLDCMHTFWKNCPTAWKGSYQGKEKKPTIV